MAACRAGLTLRSVKNTRLFLPEGEFIGTPEHCYQQPAASIRIIGEQAYIEPHEHQSAHFIYLIQGNYATSARGAEGWAECGDVIFNSPGTRHSDCFRGRGKLMTLTPHHAFLAEAKIPALEPRDALTLPHTDAACILRRIRCESEQADALSDCIIESHTLELLALVGRLAADDSALPPKWLNDVRERLQDSYTEINSVSQLADDVGVHPVYLARTFRRFTGSSPGEYLRRIRAQRAIVMLINSSMPLVEIALACGFADQPAFTKAFRRVSCLTPSAFRKQWAGAGCIRTRQQI